jgi:hypothetical protein
MYKWTVTFLSNITFSVTFLSNITFIKAKPKLPESLRSFGEIGVVTTENDIQGKLSNRGISCMFMGYSINRAHDVYRIIGEIVLMFNPFSYYLFRLSISDIRIF